MTIMTQPSANLGSERTGDRLSSPALWEKLNMTEVLYEPFSHAYWQDDFHFTPALTSATTAVNRYPYMSYIDTGNTIVMLATEKMLGVLRLSADASDNDGPIITLPGDAGTQFVISDTAGDDMPMWYEHRFRKSSITNNQAAIFLGFVEEGRCIDDGLMADNTGVPTSTIDVLAFNTPHDTGTALDFVWHKASQTRQELADVDVLVADTWYKNGFHYDPSRDTAERIRVFVNNIPHTSFVTGTQIAAATFPDAEELTWAFGLKCGEATAVTADIDWVRIAQKIRAT